MPRTCVLLFGNVAVLCHGLPLHWLQLQPQLALTCGGAGQQCSEVLLLCGKKYMLAHVTPVCFPYCGCPFDGTMGQVYDSYFGTSRPLPVILRLTQQHALRVSGTAVQLAHELDQGCLGHCQLPAAVAGHCKQYAPLVVTCAGGPGPLLLFSEATHTEGTFHLQHHQCGCWLHSCCHRQVTWCSYANRQ